MNALLCVGVVLIVLIFKSSASLAAAYGIAVTGVMVIDTFHAGIVATRQWNWNLRYVLCLFGSLAAIDWAFLASNSLKIVEGGWLPLAIAGTRVHGDGDVALRPPRHHWRSCATNPCRSISSWSAPTRRRCAWPGRRCS